MENRNVLNKQRARILTEYGNPAYFQLTKDYSFSQAPKRLLELWYSEKSLSVTSFKFPATLTQQDLDSLEKQLHNEFEKLKVRIVTNNLYSKRKDVFTWITHAVRYPLTLLNWEK